MVIMLFMLLRLCYAKILQSKTCSSRHIFCAMNLLSYCLLLFPDIFPLLLDWIFFVVVVLKAKPWKDQYPNSLREVLWIVIHWCLRSLERLGFSRFYYHIHRHPIKYNRVRHILQAMYIKLLCADKSVQTQRNSCQTHYKV